MNFKKAQDARMHVTNMENLCRNQIKQCIQDTVLYHNYKSDKIINKPTELIFCNMTSTDAIWNFKEGKTAVLNFASYKYPGGGFLSGSIAQEECLCYDSFLYNVLIDFDYGYYRWNRDNLNGGLYENRCLYSPNVTFIIGDDKQPVVFKSDVITCAAPNISVAKYRNSEDKEALIRKNSIVLYERIKFILEVAKEQEVDTLILGAFGCGVFGQSPEEVANIFKTLLTTEYKSFNKAVFAVPGDGINYQVFKHIFNN